MRIRRICLVGCLAILTREPLCSGQFTVQTDSRNLEASSIRFGCSCGISDDPHKWDPSATILVEVGGAFVFVPMERTRKIRFENVTPKQPHRPRIRIQLILVDGVELSGTLVAPGSIQIRAEGIERAFPTTSLIQIENRDAVADPASPVSGEAGRATLSFWKRPKEETEVRWELSGVGFVSKCSPCGRHPRLPPSSDRLITTDGRSFMVRRRSVSRNEIRRLRTFVNSSAPGGNTTEVQLRSGESLNDKLRSGGVVGFAKFGKSDLQTYLPFGGMYELEFK